MPAPIHRFEVPTLEPTFLASITDYITATCRAYHVKRADVFDVVQEALTDIVASIGSFQPRKGDFDTWAHGVALNVIRQHLRRAKRYESRFSAYHSNVDDYATRAPSPERCAQRKQAQCAISNVMGKLTAQQANVVVLFDIDDLPHMEIGNELGITEAASHVCHKRARKQLALCLDRELLSVTPPFLTSCNDSMVNKTGSAWLERSHYVGQLAAVFTAVFCLSSLNLTKHESTVSETRVLEHGQSVVMYRLEKPSVLLDAPNGKPEPASLPSVRDVSTPAKVVDKPANVWNSAQLPPYDYDPVSADHHLFGDECP